VSLDEWHDYMNEQARKEKAMSESIKTLFEGAVQDGNLSQKSLQALNMIDPGAAIQQGFGVKVADVKAAEVVLVTLLVDHSGSIRYVKGNSDAIRNGHNGILAALGDSKQQDGILVMCRYFTPVPGTSSNVLYPYCALKDAVQMTPQNYDPNDGTPLYDETVVTLGAVIAKTQEFEDNGVAVRSVTAIITDGADAGSAKATAAHCKSLVHDMKLAEKHIVCAMGISDGGMTDFEQVFQDMGIDKQWILTPKNSPSEIRKAFQVVSQSAVRASQSAASFSKAALGGFGG
jgi:hypothetical protein